MEKKQRVNPEIAKLRGEKEQLQKKLQEMAQQLANHQTLINRTTQILAGNANEDAIGQVLQDLYALPIAVERKRIRKKIEEAIGK